MVRSGARFEDVAQQLLATRGSFDALLLRMVELELAGREEWTPDPERVVHVLRTAFHRSAKSPGIAPWPAGQLPPSERTNS
jgi:hypothetical protein